MRQLIHVASGSVLEWRIAGVFPTVCYRLVRREQADGTRFFAWVSGYPGGRFVLKDSDMPEAPLREWGTGVGRSEIERVLIARNIIRVEHVPDPSLQGARPDTLDWLDYVEDLREVARHPAGASKDGRLRGP